MFLCYFIFVSFPPTYKFCRFAVQTLIDTTPAALNMADDDHAKRMLTDRINMLPDEFRGPFWYSFDQLIALCNLDKGWIEHLKSQRNGYWKSLGIVKSDKCNASYGHSVYYYSLYNSCCDQPRVSTMSSEKDRDENLRVMQEHSFRLGCWCKNGNKDINREALFSFHKTEGMLQYFNYCF
jgi:hypothetical protein